MAKIAFSKLNAKLNSEIKTITFHEQSIEVKQYLPINDKLTFIQNVINNVNATDNNRFMNPVKVKCFAALETLYQYTNITFTDKQQEAPEKLYDLIFTSGLLAAVEDAIPQAEREDLEDGLWDTINVMTEYDNSLLGVMDSMTKDYSNLDFDIEKLTEKLSNPEQLSLVKDIITKLG